MGDLNTQGNETQVEHIRTITEVGKAGIDRKQTSILALVLITDYKIKQQTHKIKNIDPHSCSMKL